MGKEAAPFALTALLMAGVVSHADAAPSLKILYHEGIRPQVKQVAGHTRSMSFEAYGRQFNFQLQPNPALLNAVPADRPDLEPLRGVVDGLPGSWVRMTRTRTGWYGMISDGAGELYAVEPAAAVTDSVVQPLADATASVMYRLKDALLPDGAAYCQILNVDNTPYTGENLNVSAKTSAKAMVDAIVKDATGAASFPNGPDLELTVGVAADYEFYQAESADPEGAIVARWDIVDGIWSGQVGVKIKLAPLTIVKAAAKQPFTLTDPNSLLQQLRSYRKANAAQMATGVSHLMTGKNLDGNVVGIAYMSSVCNGETADSLSEGTHSALESALIAAHELGHNFNAPHDGEAGACQSTPQTYLMAPQINYSDQFSSCSVDQISARIKTASCLIPYEAPDVRVEVPATSVGAIANTAFTVSFVAHAIGDDPSNSVTANATIPAGIAVQSATAAGGTCTTGTDGNVSCTLGDMAAQETRQIDLTLVGSAVSTTTATVSVASPNDYVSSNNSAQISIQISQAAPPASTGGGTANASGASSGGGGGGAVDLSVLAALAAAAAWRRRFKL